jgi:mycofactocin precursor
MESRNMFTETEEALSTATLDVMSMQGKYPEPQAPGRVHLKGADALADKPRVLETLVIEEVSIDGMCGVY